MPRRLITRLPRDHRLLRLETLLRLRWFMWAAQAGLIGVAQVGFGLDLPLSSLLLVLGLAAALNMALHVRSSARYRMEESAAFILLGTDVLQLGALFYFSGGISNPFAIFFLGPVLFSATALPPRRTMALGMLTIACSTFILPFHQPLRWQVGGEFILPPTYDVWLWIALQCGIVFIGAYAWRIAEDARQLVEALATTELVLEREQRLSALDGLAAAAAHELGTPLATIAIVAGELLRSHGRDESLRADLLLIKEQSARCRQILAQIPTLGEPDAAPFRTVSVSDLVVEVVQRAKVRGAPVTIISEGTGPEPMAPRNPGLFYGLGNILQNAVEFAQTGVTVTLGWDSVRLRIAISDDGPGIAEGILARLGEPYVTSRPLSAPEIETGMSVGRGGGMGLGLFIAKVLLERSGAQLEIGNAPPPGRGATIRLDWPRNLFEDNGRN